MASLRGPRSDGAKVSKIPPGRGGVAAARALRGLGGAQPAKAAGTQRAKKARRQIGHVTEQHVLKRGISRLHETLKPRADKILQLPRRPSGSHLLLRASWFERLLQDVVQVQTSLPSDITAGQSDLKHLTLEQLLTIRCRTLDFATESRSHEAHNNFLATLDQQLFCRIARQLAQGSPVAGDHAMNRMGLLICMVLGAITMLCESDDDKVPDCWALHLDPLEWRGQQVALFNSREMTVDTLRDEEIGAAVADRDVAVIWDRSTGNGPTRMFHWEVSSVSGGADLLDEMKQAQRGANMKRSCSLAGTPDMGKELALAMKRRASMGSIRSEPSLVKTCSVPNLAFEANGAETSESRKTREPEFSELALAIKRRSSIRPVTGDSTLQDPETPEVSRVSSELGSALQRRMRKHENPSPSSPRASPRCELDFETLMRQDGRLSLPAAPSWLLRARSLHLGQDAPIDAPQDAPQAPENEIDAPVQASWPSCGQGDVLDAISTEGENSAVNDSDTRASGSVGASSVCSPTAASDQLHDAVSDNFCYQSVPPQGAATAEVGVTASVDLDRAEIQQLDRGTETLATSANVGSSALVSQHGSETLGHAVVSVSSSSRVEVLSEPMQQIRTEMMTDPVDVQLAASPPCQYTDQSLSRCGMPPMACEEAGPNTLASVDGAAESDEGSICDPLGDSLQSTGVSETDLNPNAELPDLGSSDLQAGVLKLVSQTGRRSKAEQDVDSGVPGLSPGSRTDGVLPVLSTSERGRRRFFDPRPLGGLSLCSKPRGSVIEDRRARSRCTPVVSRLWLPPARQPVAPFL